MPLTAAPATELRGIHAPFFTDVFFPPQPWSTNYFGALRAPSGRTQLHVTPVQHRSESPKMTRRKFADVDFRLFYSDNTASYCGSRTNTADPPPCEDGSTPVTPALSAPPTITGVDTSSASANSLSFEVHVLGDAVAGIQDVWITWTNPPEVSGPGKWLPFDDLVQDEEDPTLWTGTLTLLPAGTGPATSSSRCTQRTASAA